jgi:hypothetical protein
MCNACGTPSTLPYCSSCQHNRKARNWTVCRNKTCKTQSPGPYCNKCYTSHKTANKCAVCYKPCERKFCANCVEIHSSECAGGCGKNVIREVDGDVYDYCHDYCRDCYRGFNSPSCKSSCVNMAAQGQEYCEECNVVYFERQQVRCQTYKCYNFVPEGVGACHDCLPTDKEDFPALPLTHHTIELDALEDIPLLPFTHHTIELDALEDISLIPLTHRTIELDALEDIPLPEKLKRSTRSDILDVGEPSIPPVNFQASACLTLFSLGLHEAS